MNVPHGRAFERAPGVSVQEIGDEAFVAIDARRTTLRLNPTATAVWRVLENPRSTSEILALFADAFPDVPADRLGKDIEAGISELVELGVLRPDTQT